MSKQRQYLPLLCTVLLLSMAAGAHAQDGPWARLRSRFSNILSRTADALELEIASRNSTSSSEGSSASSSRSASSRSTVGNSPRVKPRGSASDANPTKSAKSPAVQRPEGSTTSPVARLQQDDNSRPTCQAKGQVTAVWCREDADGALQDIAYLNSASGLQQTGCSGQQGTDSFSKVLFLDENESIISVRACSTKKDGYTAVTFITDNDQQFTCGTSSARRDNQVGGSTKTQDTQESGNHNDNNNGENDDDDSVWKAQVLARTLNNTIVNHTTSEQLRVQFVDKIKDDTENLEPRNNDDGIEEWTEPEPRSRTRSERRSRRSRQARAQSGRSHGPARLRKYFEERDIPEAGTLSEEETTASVRGQASRSLLARPAAVSIDSTVDRRLTAARHAAAHQLSSPDNDAAAAAKPTTWWWFDWGHGGNEPATGCELFTPDRAPIWATSQRLAAGNAFHSGNNKAFAKVGKDADSYVAFDNKRYYKNANTYNQYMSTFLSDPSALTFEPAWFWDQVDPLAGLSLQCKNGLASKVERLCWDKNFAPKPKPWGIKDIMALTFEATTDDAHARPFNCPRTPSQVLELEHDLQVFGQQLAGSSNGVVGNIVWQKYTPAKCVGAGVDRNTTITLTTTVVPGPGQSLLNVGFWLLHRTAEDLCDMSYNGQSVCANTDLYSVSHSIALIIGEKAQQGMMAEIQKLEERQKKEIAALQQVKAKQPPAPTK